MITSDWAHPLPTDAVFPVSAGAGSIALDARLQTLVRRSGRGDQDAFAVFYGLTVTYVSALVQASHSDHLVDELVVATYVALWEHARRADLDRIGVWSWIASQTYVAVRRACRARVGREPVAPDV